MPTKQKAVNLKKKKIGKIENMMSIKHYISFIFILFISQLQFAQKPELSVSVSKNKLGLNQRFKIEFSINKQGGDNFIPPNFNNFKVIAGPSQSVSQSWINGKVSFSQSYSYILEPKRKGELSIGAASIDFGDTVLYSESVKIIVTDAVDIPPDPNDPNYVAQQNIHLVAEVSKTNPYVGEGIYVEYRLYVSENVSVFDTQVTEAPQYIGFWNQTIDITGYPVKMGKYNGENYRYIVLQKALLIPTKSGNLTIDPMKMDIVIGVPTGRSDFFGNVLTQNIRKEFASAKKIVVPKELPLIGKPEDFKGAVGNFNFNVSINKDILRANETADVKVMVSGKGNLNLFELPEITTPAELEKYQPVRNEKINVAIDGISGSISNTYTIVPQYKGKYKIPKTIFSYFDPSDEKYHTLTNEDLYVDVIDGKPIENNNSINNNAPIEATNSFRYIQTSTTFSPTYTKDFYDSWLFYILLSIPFLAIPIGVAIAKHFEEKNKDIIGLKLRKAEKLAKKYLADASKQLGKKEAFYLALEKALHNYLKAKLGIETADISKEKIAELLQEKNVDEQNITQFINVLKNSDFARYTPVTNLQMKEEFEKAKNVIVQLDKQL